MIHKIVVVATLVVGCVTKPSIYIPDGLSVEQKFSYAVLTTDSGKRHIVFRSLDRLIYVTELDGEDMMDISRRWTYPETVYLTPGPHEIHTQYYHAFEMADTCLELNATAGERYIIRANEVGNYVQIRLENANTGSVVGNVCGFEKPPSEEGSNPQI